MRTMSLETIAPEDAWNAVAAIRSALADARESAAVAVVDAHGELLAFLRLGDCRLSASTIAINKAFTAARERESTRQTGTSLNAQCLLPAMGDHRYTTFPGGFPIKAEGRSAPVVGGIAVSGIYDECSDEWFANIGLEAIGAEPQLAKAYRKELGLEFGLVKSIFTPCAKYLTAEARLMADEKILDVGCGSGIVARLALECQPALKEARGFDFEVDAVQVARRVDRTGRVEFERGDALEEASYHPGSWDVVFAQHVLPQVPGCAPLIRKALRPGGRALVCTWPEDLADCPAYDFLYTAAGQRKEKSEDYGGWAREDLVKTFKDSGFDEVQVLDRTDGLTTPPVTPEAFLKQYLDGSLYWLSRSQQERERLFDHSKLFDLAAKVTGKGPDQDGKFEFQIAINAIVATTSKGIDGAPQIS